jgi:hypothetical protein
MPSRSNLALKASRLLVALLVTKMSFLFDLRSNSSTLRTPSMSWSPCQITPSQSNRKLSNRSINLRSSAADSSDLTDAMISWVTTKETANTKVDRTMVISLLEEYSPPQTWVYAAIGGNSPRKCVSLNRLLRSGGPGLLPKRRRSPARF